MILHGQAQAIRELASVLPALYVRRVLFARAPSPGRSNVVRIRTSVVLPAPFGAEQAQYPPGLGVQAHAGERTGRDRAGA